MVLSNFPRLSRNLPLVNLFIAGSALGFQTLVLYPWHLQIDESHNRLIKRFNDLSHEVTSLQKEQEDEQKKLTKLQIDSMANKLVDVLASVANSTYTADSSSNEVNSLQKKQDTEPIKLTKSQIDSMATKLVGVIGSYSTNTDSSSSSSNGSVSTSN